MTTFFDIDLKNYKLVFKKRGKFIKNIKFIILTKIKYLLIL